VLSAIGCAGVLLAGLGGAFEGGGLGAPAGAALAILLAAAILWISEAVPLFVTSLLILWLNLVWLYPLLGAHDRAVSADAFTSPFFSNVILLFLGGFVLSAAFRRYGLDARIAQSVLRATGDRPSWALLGFMLTTAVLSMWMSNTATAAMMLALSAPLLEDLPRDEPFRLSLLLGIPFAANLGGLGTPIGTPPNAIAVQYLRQLGDAPSFTGWLLMAGPLLLLSFAAAYGLVSRLHPARVTVVRLPSGDPDPMTARAWWVVGVTVFTILGWLTSGLHGWSSGTVALVPVVVFFGFGILPSSEFRGLPWDVLILAGGGLSLGVAVSESGLATWVVGHIPVEGVSKPLVAAAFSVTAAIMSTVMSNTATANLLIPVVLGLPDELQRPLLCVVAFSCSVSMALPVTTPPNAMAFASGQLSVRQLVVPGVVLSVLGVGLTLASLAWWTLLDLV
jgi:sodium-dependent dicarboxylate transporter 2/3/5